MNLKYEGDVVRGAIQFSSTSTLELNELTGQFKEFNTFLKDLKLEKSVYCYEINFNGILENVNMSFTKFNSIKLKSMKNSKNYGLRIIDGDIEKGGNLFSKLVKDISIQPLPQDTKKVIINAMYRIPPHEFLGELITSIYEDIDQCLKSITAE